MVKKRKKVERSIGKIKLGEKGVTGVKQVKQASDWLKKNSYLVIAVVVVVAVIGIMLAVSGPEDGPQDSSQDRSVLEITQIDCLYLIPLANGKHMGKYFGNVENSGNEIQEDVMVNVEFFDSSGESVGQASTYVTGDDVPADGKRAFYAYAKELTGRFETCEAEIEKS